MSEVKQRAPTLYLIIAIKLLKGSFLLLVAFGVYKLAGKDLGDQFDSLLHFLKFDPERKFFSAVGRWLDTITATNVRWVATGALLYSLFSLVEAGGLILRVSWAGWMAIGESAFFIPIEIYELVHRFSMTVFVILILNIFMVVYLFRNRERLFRHHHHPSDGNKPH
jgi:uncharacterized membrane protein (DUF2068 family)